jgi:hypothetical protein
MARSPFQGTYQSGIRPTIVTAPDALVYINGETQVQGCPVCKRTFDLNKYVTSIQVDLDIDSAPGSASISLSIPRHTLDDFYVDGVPILVPMMEVEIFAKGYFLLEGIPQYYPIFWGLVTEVSTGYSSGENTVTIHCSDILKWWELCRMNVNPAFTQTVGQMGRSIFGNVFYGMNPYDVIWSLAQQSFGDVVIGSGSLTSLYKEGQQKRTFSRALADMMLYWTERFSRIRSNLLLYGTRGVAVRGDTLYDLYKAGKDTLKKPFASRVVRHANGGKEGGQMVFDPTDPDVVAFRTQFNQAGQVNFWQSEYQTKLEIAQHAKESIGYEFYMDVTGDIVFKPPFYNLDVLGNKPVSWIQDIDIIEWDMTDSESEVVTQITLQGNFGGNVDYGFSEEVTPFTSVTDYHLLRQFGWRPQTFNSEFLGDTTLMFYTGMDLLDRMNSRRFRGTITIPMRPELRLGFPVYVAPLDQFWYVKGISHNIQFGGRAQTTLTLTARRRKFIAPRGMGKLKMTSYMGSGQNGNQGATPPSGASGGGSPDNIPKSTGGSQPVSNQGAVGYTARQLAANATFSLDSGGAAPMPNDPELDGGSSMDDPYAPVILRHPKTGRIMGWPNAVMIYTRPFAHNPDKLADMMGQKRQTTKSQYAKDISKAIEKKGADAVAEVGRMFQVLEQDRLDGKHKDNRYSYGLNSAGVYIYAHDQSKVIQEFLLIPKERVRDKDNKNQTTVFEGTTGMIRPISDERGFEVIGHFRYGRGVSLRDGSLVLNDTGPNSKVDVGVQLALSGDLTSSLIAQSQGLTTVSSPYPNPAATVSHLVPDDLQTGATINPDTGRAEYAPGGTTFVDTAPLGAPENAGLPPNVEASQLSMALTLAEMSVRMGETGDSAPCACVTSRPELSFINAGYQIKSISDTVPDNGTTPTTQGGTSTTDDNEYQRAIMEGRPIMQTDMPSAQVLMSRVETFLTRLYEAFDTPHMQYEKAIRGELLAHSWEGDIDPENLRFGTPLDTPGSLEPPFSAPNRYAAGDPAAIIQQAQSDKSDIKQQWSKFGEDLKKNAEEARLQQEIANLRSDIALLQEMLASAESAVKSGNGSKAEVDRIKKELYGDPPNTVGKMQQLENKLLEYNKLHQS